MQNTRPFLETCVLSRFGFVFVAMRTATLKENASRRGQVCASDRYLIAVTLGRKQ
jgi:hypothetical protein